jgi:hypothetical protein
MMIRLMKAVVGGARLALDQLTEMATEVFGAAPARGRVARSQAWIVLPTDASVDDIDVLATRVGGDGLIIFESSYRLANNIVSVTTYVAPGRNDELDVTESAVALLETLVNDGIERLDEGATSRDLTWRLATQSWEIALSRHLLSSGMIEPRVMRLPVTAIALELRRATPASDRDWEQLGQRLHQLLSSSQDVEVPTSIDHTLFAAAARTTLPH